VTATEVIEIKGLSADAEIIIDPWGIPHLRAANLDDLFFTQGFNAARDRLWQIDLWRKRGLGLLAADFGPGYLAQDYASRLFLYRGDMQAEWNAYAPDAEAICTAFTRGINAYIELTQQEPDLLPPEFALMNTKPAEWQAEDVVRIRSHSLTRNALSEILRARILSRTDLDTDLLRKLLEPAIVPQAADGIDLGSIPLDIITLFKLGTASVNFSKERLACPLEKAWTWTQVNDLGDVLQDLAATGSNNWVIGPEKSASGRPIMANDPHRAHSLPSLRYIVHLSAPGLDVIGAGEPVLPGIHIGHNGHSAFGLTIFYSDQEDVYVYDTDPTNPTRYRWQDGWAEMQRVDERFVVRGAPDQILPQNYTKHGPVLFEDKLSNRAYGVRSVWFEPGSSAYFKSIASMRTKNLADYREAMRGWGVPSVNHVYADVTGTFAWVPAGWTPLRAGWDGLLPVPGDGRFEWQGFLDHEKLPRVVSAEKGFFATANEMNLPDDFPYAVGYEWIDRARTDRIHDRLHALDKVSVADSCALQTDPVSHPARRLAALALAHVDEPIAQTLFSGWNGSLDAQSAAGALCEIWWTKHLKPKLLAQLVPDADLRALILPGDIESFLRALENPDGRFGSEAERARNALIRETIAEALVDCRQRLGDDPGLWQWGRVHHAFFEHPLAAVVPSTQAWNIGPFSHGGSGTSPMHTGYRPSDFRTMQGASVRIVVDVGDWDQSRCINAPGQSGDPRSPHYRDIAPLWADGQYVPLLYTRTAIDAVATAIIKLKPVK
jgi:penicillin G amidase